MSECGTRVPRRPEPPDGRTAAALDSAAAVLIQLSMSNRPINLSSRSRKVRPQLAGKIGETLFEIDEPGTQETGRPAEMASPPW